LKDILNDVNVYFTDKGMRILTLDTARVALVDMFLASENFEEYECSSPLVAGINVTNMFKLLKFISNNDTLAMEVRNREYLDIRIENATKKTDTKFQLKLLDINEDQIEVPGKLGGPEVPSKLNFVGFQVGSLTLTHLILQISPWRSQPPWPQSTFNASVAT
jgi:proliferating cell nuclear antigen PCNA